MFSRWYIVEINAVFFISVNLPQTEADITTNNLLLTMSVFVCLILLQPGALLPLFEQPYWCVCCVCVCVLCMIVYNMLQVEHISFWIPHSFTQVLSVYVLLADIPSLICVCWCVHVCVTVLNEPSPMQISPGGFILGSTIKLSFNHIIINRLHQTVSTDVYIYIYICII